MKSLRFSWIALACAWLAPSSSALAQQAQAHLEWQRPLGSTCPPQALLEQDVEQALGRRIFTSVPSAPLSVRGTIEERTSGVFVRFEARNRAGTLLGTRELHAPAGECGRLRNDIGVVLTLLVERDDSFAEPDAPTPLRLELGLWGGFLFNVLPRADLGVGPALALNVGESVQLRADAAYWLPVAIQTAQGIRAELQGASLALRVCPRIAGRARGVLSLSLCGGPQLGTLIASQTQPEVPGLQLRLLAQGLVELRGALRWGGSGRVELALGPVISLSRTSIFSVRSDGERMLLYRLPALGLILSLCVII